MVSEQKKNHIEEKLRSKFQENPNPYFGFRFHLFHSFLADALILYPLETFHILSYVIEVCFCCERMKGIQTIKS